MARLQMFLDATQARAELTALDITNRRVATSISTTWGMVNKTFMAGAAGIAAMGVGFGAAYLANAEFNKALTHTQALSDLTTKQIKGLTQQVSDLAMVYGESSNVIAQGLVVLSKAGLTYEEITTAMPTIVQMMKANAVDFETAANIAMMTMNAFSLEYGELAEIGDKAQKAFQATLMDIEDLQQGLQYAASTAAMAGVPFESLIAMMGTLADNAMVAGIASRSMNKMLLDIVTHTDEVQRWADSMGLGVDVIKDGVININEIIPAFAKLGMSLDTLIESSDIFTVRALRSWGILIGHSDEYLNLLEQIQTSQGELTRTTDIQITSLQTAMSSMKEMILAPLRTPEMTQTLAKVLNDLRESMKGLAPEIASLVKHLMEGFAENLPNLISLLHALVHILSSASSVLMVFGNIVAGIPEGLLKMLVVFYILKRIGLVDLFMRMVTSTQTLAFEYERLSMQLHKLNTDYQILAVTAQTRQQAYQVESMWLKIQEVQYQRRMMLLKNLSAAYAGLAMGAYMAISGYTREARAMGALISVITSLTVAYQLLAVAKASASPWKAVAQVAAAATVAAGIGAAAYGLLSKPRERPTVDMPKFEYPQFAGVGTTVEGTFQKGGIIPKTGLYLMHKGEPVGSANKEHPTGGSVVGTLIMQPGVYIVDEGGFLDWLESELGRRHRSQLRRRM